MKVGMAFETAGVSKLKTSWTTGLRTVGLAVGIQTGTAAEGVFEGSITWIAGAAGVFLAWKDSTFGTYQEAA
jgi:hypothetical protein